MDEVFKIQIKGNCHTLERLTYPRFRALLDCNKPLAEIIRINLIEEGSPSDIAKALEELEIYLKNYKSENK